jgi:hypothetical protein
LSYTYFRKNFHEDKYFRENLSKSHVIRIFFGKWSFPSSSSFSRIFASNSRENAKNILTKFFAKIQKRTFLGQKFLPLISLLLHRLTVKGPVFKEPDANSFMNNPHELSPRSWLYPPTPCNLCSLYLKKNISSVFFISATLAGKFYLSDNAQRSPRIQNWNFASFLPLTPPFQFLYPESGLQDETYIIPASSNFSDIGKKIMTFY